eukprot:6178880-Pleurochrysis_carterae.AAC.1
MLGRQQMIKTVLPTCLLLLRSSSRWGICAPCDIATRSRASLRGGGAQLWRWHARDVQRRVADATASLICMLSGRAAALYWSSGHSSDLI